MRLREARKADLKTIIAWVPNEQDCILWAGPRVRFPLSVEGVSQDIGFSDGNTYCYESDDAVVAFGQLVPKEKDRLHFARIIVDPAKRGNGYGKLLCAELIQIAIRKRCQKISLNVYRNNESAFNLYMSLGFR